MVVPPKHPKMIISSRKTYGCYHHFRKPPHMIPTTKFQPEFSRQFSSPLGVQTLGCDILATSTRCLWEIPKRRASFGNGKSTETVPFIKNGAGNQKNIKMFSFFLGTNFLFWCCICFFLYWLGLF